MYCNLWNIREVRDHYFSDYSLDQGIFKKSKGQLDSKCPSSYSILKTSIASRIRSTTGRLLGIPCPNHIFSASRNSRRYFCRVRREAVHSQFISSTSFVLHLQSTLLFASYSAICVALQSNLINPENFFLLERRSLRTCGRGDVFHEDDVESLVLSI
jgi:hypothetical protein